MEKTEKHYRVLIPFTVIVYPCHITGNGMSFTGIFFLILQLVNYRGNWYDLHLTISYYKVIYKKTNTVWILFPALGILIFIILYIVAAMLYPGGSDVNPSATGFSWQHNYWCELMATEAQNGQLNSARPVAISAMFVLAISLIIFWCQVPLLFQNRKMDSRVIRCCGIGSMIVLPFLLKGMHDAVINLSALLGCIAIVALLLNLFRYKMNRLLYLGLCCLLLCGINNYIYYSGYLLHLLPVIQKLSFFVFLLWFSLLTIKLYRKKTLCHDVLSK